MRRGAESRGRPHCGHAAAVGLAALVAVLGTACASPEITPSAAPTRSAAPGDPSNLRGICPNSVVVQTNWWPQAEYGALYRLLGPNPRTDADRKSVSGSLVSQGVDTGVTLEIRSGGPATSFVPAATTLYTDESVLLGGVDLDQAAQFSADKPVQAVFAPMDSSPVVLMWDPGTHPEFRSIADVGKTDTPVLYFQGSTYVTPPHG
jgi:hypothetical protein